MMVGRVGDAMLAIDLWSYNAKVLHKIPILSKSFFQASGGMV